MSQTLSELRERYQQFAPDPDLHGTYYPTNVYPGESISARITIVDHGRLSPEPVRIWRISPLGLELLVDPKECRLAVGQLVDIDLRLGSSVTSLSGLAIVKTTNELGNKIIGVRLVARAPQPFDGTDRRGNPRWICSEQFLPSCVATNPARFGDFVYLRVKEISANGMRL